MIDRKIILENLDEYDPDKIKIGVLASHSALDVADGAIEEGFKTILYCQKGREKTYTLYFKSKRVNGRVVRGVVDEFVIYDKFDEMIKKEEQEKMLRENVLFVPNRSFTSYISLDRIEDEFYVPIVGSRNLLRSEERGGEKDYYWLLERANLPYPERIENPEDIDELCIVKMHHAKKKLERGFFTASSYKEYKEKAEKLIRRGVITKDLLENARIEKYIIGPVFNFDFFYSPLEEEMAKIELLGVDWRFETSLDGQVRLPAQQQLTLPEKQSIPEYTVCGHSFATIRESLLEKAFELAEKYVKATQRYFEPGIIGPFCLQTCIDKDNNFFIYDVAPRIGGGTNAHMYVGHPYGNILWRGNVSTGRRLAMEIRRAIDEDKLEKIVT
ncbi:MAG: 5-formaminoimidazole-4-carboxamide-1-(beta)-D-ribofuranosyl 5'-monophosphate synthetase [Candidatus Altiarchaeales archaeon]|nr:MAG: 5-formaminoimidazole-4-carboxamide-1-(beta)-D-ribofuranosyl 5'-monophosphate synthetase [Candidatus Altiarchaeales archaeon]RLI94958.1 MAG: 5-formaminoimidazole-4-carboxamide-1-(beta)-D-ribofuranosyl 5'-monophosphate synthetase [Candidatus Altiarchaeales archaeon]HDO82341.1 formate--phosphoribosylaminoimidazolecarboxamide ligase family protein [Candidatus Altiarchaeales archaeon]HEX54990.1 formate--phosphoribosylaminoimidazolecarboxamide ligase family protein [Candidatus Altiarchaeales a